MKDQVVAIKTIRPGLLSQGQSDTLRSLMLEIKVLQYIGSFENVVRLIGCNTVNLISGKIFMITQFYMMSLFQKCKYVLFIGRCRKSLHIFRILSTWLIGKFSEEKQALV